MKPACARLFSRLLVLITPPALRPPPRWPELTPRQQEIAWMIRLGFSNAQIAEQLIISMPTVKSHVHRLLHKFNLPSRHHLQDLLNAVDYRPVDDTWPD